jgi:hypothetical protein
MTGNRQNDTWTAGMTIQNYVDTEIKDHGTQNKFQQK